MAMDSTALTEALKTAINAKVREKNPDMAAKLDNEDETAKGDLTWLIDSISEAVAEEVLSHVKTHAAVSVPVIGLDQGTALPSELLNKLVDRGDGLGPYTPDAALQQDTSPAPTTAAAASVVLSIPGLVD